MRIELEHELTSNGQDIAYIFNDKLQHLTFPEGVSIKNDSVCDEEGNILYYVLKIPERYLDPDNSSTTLQFEEGDLITIRYNSPITRGISMAIGKMYFEKKPAHYATQPDIPRAECILLYANGTTSEFYPEFGAEYTYQIPLETTPFNNEYMGSFATIKANINLTQLQAFADDNGYIDFSDIMFSINDPSYELTVDEIVLMRHSREPSSEYANVDSRVWQYTETELFEVDEDPSDDVYSLTLDETPIFYEESNDLWLDYLNIYDSTDNYYSAGIFGDQYQLHYNETTQSLSWNPTFNQYPEYFGMDFEEPLIIEANQTLYVQYCTNSSWTEEILLEYENIDLNSIRAVYDYNYLLKPDHYEWYGDLFGYSHNYEHVAYSFKDDCEYQITQYYSESFEMST